MKVEVDEIGRFSEYVCTNNATSFAKLAMLIADYYEQFLYQYTLLLLLWLLFIFSCHNLVIQFVSMVEYASHYTEVIMCKG